VPGKLCLDQEGTKNWPILAWNMTISEKQGPRGPLFLIIRHGEFLHKKRGFRFGGFPYLADASARSTPASSTRPVRLNISA